MDSPVFSRASLVRLVSCLCAVATGADQKRRRDAPADTVHRGEVSRSTHERHATERGAWAWCVHGVRLAASPVHLVPGLALVGRQPLLSQPAGAG